MPFFQEAANAVNDVYSRPKITMGMELAALWAIGDYRLVKDTITGALPEAGRKWKEDTADLLNDKQREAFLIYMAM